MPGIPRSEQAIVEALRRSLDQHPEWLGGLSPLSLAVNHVAIVPGQERQPDMAYVQFVQHAEGMPVEGTYVNCAVKLLDRRSVLMDAQATLYPQLRLPPRTPRDLAAMLRSAAESVGLAAGRAQAVRERHRVRYLGGRWRRIYELRFAQTYDAALIDTDVPESWIEDERLYESLQGRVQGRGVRFDPIATGQELPTLDLSSLRVTAASGSASYSDASGVFIFPSETAATNIRALLEGRWSRVQSMTGADLLLTSSATPGVSVPLLFNPVAAEEFATAQINGYYHTTFIHDWVKARLLGGLPDIDVPLQVYVNREGRCNAFFDIAAISFFKSGSGCLNAAYDTVIYHEYGHVVDIAAGEITNRGLSEGWGDVLASYATQQPLIGEGFQGSGTLIRTADNAYQYPPDGQDAVWSLGQAWAGFAWNLRSNLMASQGASAGVALAEQLVIPVLLANSPDIPSAVLQVLLRDDDDGTLANGTPHQAEILDAASRHSIPIPEDDVIPPSPVNNLAAESLGLDRMELTWTATGDDDFTGTATKYDIRYATAPMATDDEFQRATTVSDAPTPKPSGSWEKVVVTGLVPGTTYYTAMKVLDNMGNVSSLSNPASATTRSGRIVFSENFESGAPDWTMSGLWHLSQQRAGSPSISAAYNNGVDYETGAPNSGALLSPPITLSAGGEVLLVFSHWFETEQTPTPIAYDIRKVKVSADGGISWGYWWPWWDSTIPAQPFWAPISLDLSRYAGQTIQIGFFFDTVDAAANHFEGWYVDDVALFTDASNRPPVLDPIGDKTVREGEILAFTVSGSDPDGDALTYSTTPLPADALFDSVTKTFSWTPAYDQAGTYQVTFEVSDGDSIDAETITITVQEVIRAVTGAVRQPTGAPVAGITIRLKQPRRRTPIATTTDAQGAYRFVGVLPAVYAIQPLPTRRWSFTPAQRSVDLTQRDALGVDFTARPRRR
ncbi:MAG: putative Ig domain-containing protein [Candidatus Omnitrophota bacterium]|nr:putative Ig domain-containing protein [Candidatus Omnitrophota bacterium]